MYQWMENLSFYMILITVVLQLLPDNSYQKYIRFFTGLMLVVMLAAPVFEILGMQEEFFSSCEQAVEQEERSMERAMEKFMENVRLTEEIQSAKESAYESEMDQRP